MAPWIASEQQIRKVCCFLLFFPAYLDRTAVLQYDKGRNQNRPNIHILSFEEIHISQAQVSRLEKGALEHIRKQI